MKEIDKVAYIKIKDGRILTAKSKGKLKFYIPGGKRENNESDQETLIREIKEELDINIISSSIKYFGTFKAQADGRDKGVIVKMTCYEADYLGQLKACSEIEEISWMNYEDLDKVSFVDKIIFDYLKEQGRLT